MRTAGALTEDAVLRLVQGRFGMPWLWRPSCASTQDLLRGTGLPEGAVAAAEHQTAGRGRSGRGWEDHAGLSVLVSILLRPPYGSGLPQLSLVAGLAVATAIETVTELRVALKWPNDVLIGGRKTAGILIEGDGDAVVCGIGINVAQTSEELPAKTRLPATSLRVETGTTPDRATLLAALLDELARHYDTWRHDGLDPLLPGLEDRNALRGTGARASGIEGTIGPIQPDGRLALVDAGGMTHLVVSGEVEPLD
jgi:BirA family biotin operon repressor/biotin-[acetyl-CoA-carboxylase] ligase